jgi:hypothetical protein
MELEIRGLLQEEGVPFKQSGKSFILTCPRCNKKDKLYIRRRDGRFVCWVCSETDGFHGKPEFALSELCSLPTKEIKAKLYGEDVSKPTETYIDLGLDGYLDDDEDFIELPAQKPVVQWPDDFFPIDDDQSLPGAIYLARRGIAPGVAMEYGIRYCPGTKRVIFPVESRGELYGWQGRVIDDTPFFSKSLQRLIVPSKALTSTGLQKDKVLMFADRIKSNHCVMTEGPIDAIKATLCGGNVATLGKAVSEAQLNLIRNAGVDRLYLGLDPDAYLEIDRIRKKMSDLQIYDLRPPPPYKDLGEMSLEGVKALFDGASELNPAQIILYLKSHFGAP